VTRKELYFIGMIGFPYYLMSMIFVVKLQDCSNWFLLLFLLFWYVYDYFSQPAYIAKVKSGFYSKVQYVFRSLGYQLLFISILTLVIQAIET